MTNQNKAIGPYLGEFPEVDSDYVDAEVIETVQTGWEDLYPYWLPDDEQPKAEQKSKSVYNSSTDNDYIDNDATSNPISDWISFLFLCGIGSILVYCIYWLIRLFLAIRLA